MSIDDDLIADPGAISLLDGLRTNAPPDNYGPWDRMRDFRQLFLGSPQGQRVLHLILARAGLMRTPVQRLESGTDPYATFRAIGFEDFAKWILSVLTVEPKIQPSMAETEEER